MDERAAFYREGEFVDPLLKFDDTGRVREFFQRYREWFPDECMEEGRSSRYAEDLQSLFQPELDERMETGDVVDMEMGKKEIDGLLLRDIPVCLGDPVAGIEDDIIFASLDKNRDRVAGGVSYHPLVPRKVTCIYRILVFIIKKGAPFFNQGPERNEIFFAHPV